MTGNVLHILTDEQLRSVCADDSLPERIRKKAFREYDVGTVFRESDGLFVIISKTNHVGPSNPMTYDYVLRRMPPDLELIWSVMLS